MCAITNSLTDGRAGGRRCSCVWGLDCAAGSVPSKAQHTLTGCTEPQQAGEGAAAAAGLESNSVRLSGAAAGGGAPHDISSLCVRVQ